MAIVGAQAIYMAEANFLFPPNSIPYIYIRSDGSIEPSNAPITRNGNVYTLTSNITDRTLGIECDDVIVDGAGYTISGDNKSSPAISIGLRSNVTVKNVCIAWFCSAHIAMGGATNCTITNTTIFTVAGGAMTLNGCNNCTITNNTFHNADLLYDDGRGESVYCGGNGNIISGNNFLGGEVGLTIYGSSDTVINNTFTGTKKYLAVSRTEPHIIENNTVNGIIISETPYITPSPSLTITQTPSSNPTLTSLPSPSPPLTPIPTASTPSPSSSPTQQPTLSPTLTPTPLITVFRDPNEQLFFYLKISAITLVAILVIVMVAYFYFKKRRG